MATDLLQCYNKGCQQRYDPTTNVDGSCQYHPGGPIFHDALKGWSCCKKRSTDFTEFLNIPGCKKGLHSNEKPVEAEKPEVDPNDRNGVIVHEVKPQVIKPADPSKRPCSSEPVVRLKSTVGASLQQALEKQLKDMAITTNKEEQDVGGEVKVGTVCKNSGCTKQFESVATDLETCVHHTGVPIFHEGMKYWSCCQRKTSDFNSFLSQEGCERGQHMWVKKESEEKKVSCRYDWHQTAGFVTVSIFCKVALPEKSWVEANKVSCKLHMVFDGGKSTFEEQLTLRGVVDPTKSNIKMLGTKVEVNLKKLEPGSWATLQLPKAEQKKS